MAGERPDQPDQPSQDQEAQAREAQARAGAEDPLEAHEKALVKASERIWKEGRRKIEGRVKDKETGSRRPNYNFRLNRLTENLLGPIDKKWGEYKVKKNAILRSGNTPEEQIQKLTELQGELNKEITTGVENVLAFLDQMTEEEYEENQRLNHRALAHLEVYQGFFIKLMESEKGKPLAKIFSRFISLRELGDNKEYEETLEKALLDPEMTPIAFFVLTMAHKKVRKEFATGFIKRHPEKTVWLVDTGNRYGCFDPNEMRALFEYARQNFPEAKASVDKELQDFGKYEKVYRIRFNGADLINQRIKGLMVNASGNPALEKLTFKGVGRFVANVAAIATLIANFTANRELILSNPTAFLKNPYVLGALGVLGYMHKSGKEERLGDTFTGEATKNDRKYGAGIKRLRETLDSSAGWSNFFDKEGGVELLTGYKQYLSTQTRFSDKIPDSEDFLEYCRKNEPKTKESKRPSKILAEIVKRDKKMANLDLNTFMEIFFTELQSSSVTTGAKYKKILLDADERFI